MARRKRSELPDGTFHVIAHAVAGEPLFCDDVDRKRYLGLLQLAAEEHRWRVLSFALLTNHVHLLAVTAAKDLSGALWFLHSNYAAHFQRRHPPRPGHVFARRPITLPVTDESYLLATLRYIARNPVKAGICSDPAKYAWSAHRVICGTSPPLPIVAVDDVLALFHHDPAVARGRYDDFVRGVDPAEHDAVRRLAEGPPRDRPSLAELLAAGDRVDAARTAHARWGYSARAIASACGVSHPTISKWLKARPLPRGQAPW